MIDLHCGQKVAYRAFDLASNTFQTKEGTIQKCIGSCIITDDGWVIETACVSPIANV